MVLGATDMASANRDRGGGGIQTSAHKQKPEPQSLKNAEI